MEQQASWTIEEIIAKLAEIKAKGFIPIPPEMYRTDEGVVGQILEREFGIPENNLRIGDLGKFELKGMRKTSSTLTLCHRKPETGLNPIQIFDRFGQVKPSNRDKTVMKKKFFNTITGKKENKLGLRLQPEIPFYINLFHSNEFICRWNLTDAIEKMNKVIVVFADTVGQTNSKSETFHFIKANLYSGLKPLDQLVVNGKIVIDFCIDQPVGDTHGPHDRGPHIRIPKTQLSSAYREISAIL